MGRSSFVALMVVAVLVAWVNCRNGSKRQRGPASGRRRVEVNFRTITYWENDEPLQLAWEPQPGKQPIAYVPSERLWDEVMPEWAVRRRGEIMEIVKKETAFMKFIWQEYDAAP